MLFLEGNSKILKSIEDKHLLNIPPKDHHKWFFWGVPKIFKKLFHPFMFIKSMWALLKKLTARDFVFVATLA